MKFILTITRGHFADQKPGESPYRPYREIEITSLDELIAKITEWKAEQGGEGIIIGPCDPSDWGSNWPARTDNTPAFIIEIYNSWRE